MTWELRGYRYRSEDWEALKARVRAGDVADPRAVFRRTSGLDEVFLGHAVTLTTWRTHTAHPAWAALLARTEARPDRVLCRRPSDVGDLAYRWTSDDLGVAAEAARMAGVPALAREDVDALMAWSRQQAWAASGRPGLPEDALRRLRFSDAEAAALVGTDEAGLVRLALGYLRGAAEAGLGVVVWFE